MPTMGARSGEVPRAEGAARFASRAVIGTQAHVGGVPVEETVLALAPVAWALLAGGRLAAGGRGGTSCGGADVSTSVVTDSRSERRKEPTDGERHIDPL